MRPEDSEQKLIELERKLEGAREKAAGYGEKFGRKETADDKLKMVYAILYEFAVGSTVPERDSWVKRHADYKKAVEDKENAYADWKTAETWMKLLFTEAEVWRTDCANTRGMDRAHR